MSIHTYKRQSSGKVVRVKSVDTVAKLRKRPDCVHSITTVTGDIKNDFLDFWKDKELYRLATENPTWDLDKCIEARWGYRTHPTTGEQMTSSDFGTAAHESVENGLNHLKEGADYHDDYSPLTRPFFRAIETSVHKPVWCEKMVLDERRRIGGTIDFVSEDAFGNYAIWDFKFRTSTKAYDKDMVQLSIAADIIMNEENLDYLPQTHSVVFNCNDGKMKITNWTERQRWEGVAWFDDQNKCYMRRNGLL
jgi:hypothetical protein